MMNQLMASSRRKRRRRELWSEKVSLLHLFLQQHLKNTAEVIETMEETKNNTTTNTFRWRR